MCCWQLHGGGEWMLVGQYRRSSPENSSERVFQSYTWVSGACRKGLIPWRLWRKLWILCWSGEGFWLLYLYPYGRFLPYLPVFSVKVSIISSFAAIPPSVDTRNLKWRKPIRAAENVKKQTIPDFCIDRNICLTKWSFRLVISVKLGGSFICLPGFCRDNKGERPSFKLDSP